jgi:hypothetical protein
MRAGHVTCDRVAARDALNGPARVAGRGGAGPARPGGEASRVVGLDGQSLLALSIQATRICVLLSAMPLTFDGGAGTVGVATLVRVLR